VAETKSLVPQKVNAPSCGSGELWWRTPLAAGERGILRCVPYHVVTCGESTQVIPQLVYGTLPRQDVNISWPVTPEAPSSSVAEAGFAVEKQPKTPRSSS